MATREDKVESMEGKEIKTFKRFFGRDNDLIWIEIQFTDGTKMEVMSHSYASGDSALDLELPAH